MKLKSILYTLVIISMAVLAACSSSNDGNNENDETLNNANEENNGDNDNGAVDNLNATGMPIVDEPIDLQIFAGKAATTADDWNDVLLLNEYEEMTNVNIDWEQAPADGLDEKRNLALASNSLPDVFYAANVPVSDIQKYGDQGTFIPLEDLIEEYAPNVA